MNRIILNRTESNRTEPTPPPLLLLGEGFRYYGVYVYACFVYAIQLAVRLFCNRGPPNRTEPNRAERKRIERNRIEPNGTEANRTESNRIEPPPSPSPYFFRGRFSTTTYTVLCSQQPACVPNDLHRLGSPRPPAPPLTGKNFLMTYRVLLEHNRSRLF